MKKGDMPRGARGVVQTSCSAIKIRLKKTPGPSFIKHPLDVVMSSGGKLTLE